MLLKVIVCLLLTVPVYIVLAAIETTVQPEVSTKLNIQTVNGGDQEAVEMRAEQRASVWPYLVVSGWTVLVATCCFGPSIKRGFYFSEGVNNE